MPYNFTHALVGLSAIDQTSEPAAALVRANMREFLIGTMGPDPYFGDSMPKPLFRPCRVDLAEKLHTLDARVLFAALLPLARKSKPKQAYILGFLCHFLLDTNAHPYIEARFAGKAHTPAEIQMDLMMTARLSFPGVPDRPRRFYRTKHLKELDELHAELCLALFSMQTRGVFTRGFRKWILINALTYDPTNRKRAFFGKLERFFHAPGKITNFLVSRHPDPDDRLNIRQHVWNAPWAKDAARTESFVALFERACKEAPELMRTAFLAMNGADPAKAIAQVGARRMDARPV